MKKTLLILLLLLVGCDQVQTFAKDNNIGWLQPKEYIEVTDPVPEQANQGNMTELGTLDIGDISYFIAKDTVVVMDNHSAIVLDSGGYSAATILQKYNINPSVIVSTNSENTQTIKNLIFFNPPKRVYDNGLDTDQRKAYMKYQESLGFTVEVLKNNKQVIGATKDIYFFVPYKDGFLNDEKLNSIAVKVNNLLYMSDCYGVCQNKVDTKAKYIVLANGGKCPTNDFYWVQLTGAKYIFGEELCPDFLSNALLDDMDQLEAVGIEFRQIQGIIGVQDE